MGDIGAKDDLRFRDYLLKQGITTEEEIEETLRNKSKESSLGEALLEKGVLTPDQLNETVRITRGDILQQTRPHELPPEVVPYGEDEAHHLGKYVLTTVLGTGGIGEVFRAWDTELRRWVAVKVLKDLDKANAREWLRREAQVAAGLDHPNIIRVYDVGDEEGVPFIAMQLIEGQSLELAQKELSLPAKVLASRKIAEALQYAHGKSVIHRDLKPANVMVDREGEVFVLDFGLAKETKVSGHTLSMTGMVVGTPSYMSPEQAKGKATRQSDVYGVGAILYQLVTGRPPFTGNTLTDVLTQVLFKDPVWPRVLTPDIPRDLEAILLKALEKEPSRRYATVGELLEDIKSYLDEEPLKHARRPTIGYVFAKRIRKQPLIWGLGAALAGSVLFGSGFGAYTLIERNRVEREGREKAELERKRADDEATKAKMAALQSKSLLDARRALEWGEGNDLLLSILKKAASESDPDSVWLTEAGRLLYETNDRKMFREAERFLVEATTLDTVRAYEALYYLHLIHDKGRDAHSSKYLNGIRIRAKAIGDNDNVFVLISRCDEAIEIEDYEKAFDLADRAVKNGRNISDTWYHRGKVHAKTGNLEGAIEDYSHALDLNQYYVLAWIARGLARKINGDLNEAIKDYTRAIEINPRGFQAWGYRGRARAQKGDFDGAIEDYTRVIEMNPKNTDAWVSRGYSLRQKGDFDGAIDDCTRAIEIDPNSANAWVNRGSSLRQKGDLEEAIRDYTRSIEIDPKNIDAWNNRGATRAKNGDGEGAIEDYSRAIEIDPKDAAAWNNRGQARSKNNDREGAIADYTRAIEIDPKDAKPRVKRGHSRWQTGDLDGAIEDFTGAIEIDPENVSAWNNRGAARAQKGDFGGAIRDYTRVIEIDPKDVSTWNNRGAARAMNGDLNGAIWDFSRAIELNPKNEGLWTNRGFALSDKGDLPGAIEDLSRAIELNPNSRNVPALKKEIEKLRMELEKKK